MMTTIKAKRKEQDLTQEELAHKVGISKRAYQNYETKKRVPDADVAILIADELHSTVEELFRRL